MADKWYGVSATYKEIHVGVSRRRHLWQRIIFVVCAASELAAKEVAVRVAEEKQHEYLAAGGDIVRWVFQEVETIQEILDQEFRPGTEVLWEFYQRVDKQR